MPYNSIRFKPSAPYQRNNSGGMGAAPPAAKRHWSNPKAVNIFFCTKRLSNGILSSIASFFGGILPCTPSRNLSHNLGTEKKKVGLARCKSCANVSWDSTKKTCIPVASNMCSTKPRSAMCDKGKYDNILSFSSKGIRLSPCSIMACKVPKLCITPFGLPVVPEVYITVHRFSAGRTTWPCSGACLPTMSDHFTPCH